MKRFFLFFALFCAALMPLSAVETVECDQLNQEYYKADNDWYVTLKSDNYWFIFDIVATTLQSDQTYTLADMLADYTVVEDYRSGKKTYRATSAEYTQSVDAEGHISISASMSVQIDGQTVDFQILYGESPCVVDPSAESFSWNFIEEQTDLIDYSSTSGLVQFVGTSDLGELSVCYKSASVTGTYTTDDMFALFCYLETTVEGQTLHRALCSVEVTVNEPEEGVYAVQVSAITENGESVQASLRYDPTVCNHWQDVDIVSTNLSMVDSRAMTGEVCVHSVQGDYDLSVWVRTDELTGEWGTADLNPTNSFVRYRVTGAKVPVVRIELLSEPDPQQADRYIVTGTLITGDCHRYHVNLRYVKPLPTREMTLSISDAELTDATSSLSYYEISGYTADMLRYASVNLLTKSLTGTFDDIDFDPNQTFCTDVDKDDPYLALEFYDYVSGTAVADVVDSVLTVRAEVLTRGEVNPDDVVLFHLTLSTRLQHGLPNDADTDVKDVLPEVTEGLYYLLSDHAVQISAINPDSRGYAFMLFYVEDTNPTGLAIPEGDYPISDSMEEGTVLASFGVSRENALASFYTTVSEAGELDLPAWLMKTGMVNVKHVDGEYAITVDALNSTEHTIRLLIGAAVSGLSPVTSSPRATRFLRDGHIYLRWGTTTYDLLGRPSL